MASATIIPGVVAVTDTIQACGAIVYWRLSGAADRLTLANAWAAAGLPGAPPECTEAAALRGVMADLCVGHGGRKLSRPLADGQGYAIVDETPEGKRDLSHAVKLTAVVLPSGTVDVAPAWDPRADEIRRGYVQRLAEVSHTALGPWLAQCAARECRAVALRPTGGIYFVPAARLDLWRRMATVVTAHAPVTIYEIPALQGDGIVQGVLDSLCEESHAALSEIETELAQGGLGKRALDTREATCKALRDKLSTYADLLGPALDTIRGILDETEQHVANAVLAAEAE